MNSKQTILIRYDEIGLKGRNRRHFIEQLRSNIALYIREFKNIKVRAPHGRVFVDCESGQVDDVIKRLKHIPGIASMSVGVIVEPELDRMTEQGIQWLEPLLDENPHLKFCVRTRRAHKGYPLMSFEVDRDVGGRIMEALSARGLSVSINQADFTLEIEIGLQQTVMFKTRIPGLGGLPVGSAGKVLGLLSGGIDSPVALFRLIRRGCRVHAVFFDNRPFMGKGGFEKVRRLCEVLNRFQISMRLFVVPFEDIQVAIRDQCRPNNRVVLYRRMMYRIAETIAEREEYGALITGESLGQVASQTLENLEAVSRVISTSMFRPLIGMDKKEIIAEAKMIGTYDISIEPQPDCCSVFMPPNPATRAKLAELERDETRYPFKELMQEALGKMEILYPEVLAI